MPQGERRGGERPGVDYGISLGDHRFDPIDTLPPPRAGKGRSGGRAVADEAGRAARARRAGRDAEDAEPAEDVRAPDPADTRLVQFVQPLAGEDIARIRSEYGLALTAYVPNLTYVERVDADTERRLQDDPLVRAIAPYLAEYKVSRAVDDDSLARPEGVGPGQLLIDAMLFDGASTDRVVGTVQAAGGHEVIVLDDRDLGGTARVRFTVDDRAALDEIAQLPDIRWMEPVARAKEDNVAATSVIQSGDAGNALIWAKGLHGENHVIGIIDGGPIDIRHCFFADAAPNTAGPAHRKVVSIRNATGTPPHDHATFVAGCAAGDERNNAGNHNRRGGAWAARLASANRRDISGGTSTLLRELTAGMAAGAFVHSNSWHFDRGNPSAYDVTCADADTFTWTNEDHLVLGSAGNNGEEQGPPGTAKSAICVGAAQSGGSAMNFGDGNAGPTADGRRKPDLMAVGCGIESALIDAADRCAVGPRSACATSYATPHAGAAAVLVRQYFTEGWYPTGAKVAANALTPTGALMRAVLINSTVDMTGVAGYPSDTEGFGLVRLDRALFFAGGRRKLNVWDVRHATGPTTGETRTHELVLDADTEQLKVVLCWSDPAPAVGSFANPVVNDLDLGVLAPDGTTGYVGNDFQNGVSRARNVQDPAIANLGDRLNTVEIVVVDNPPAGRWTIVVRVSRVAVGNPGQGYAVAATARLKSGGCFVATTVYGDPDHADVEALRAWRERHLGAHGARWAAMAALAGVYEAVGPGAARAVEGRLRLKRALRTHVFPRIAAAVRGDS